MGIVGDMRNDLARPDAQPMAYRSHRQESTQRLGILLRTHGDTLALSRLLQREVPALDPSPQDDSGPVQRRGARRVGFAALVRCSGLVERPRAFLRVDRRGTTPITARRAVFTDSDVGNAAATSGSRTTAMARPLRDEA